MSKARHPENIFSNGPTSLNPDSIKDEIVTLKLGLKLNAILSDTHRHFAHIRTRIN